MYRKREWEREPATDRQENRQTVRQTDMQTETETKIDVKAEADRERDLREKYKQTEIESIREKKVGTEQKETGRRIDTHKESTKETER